jgi:hypothetical protein
MSEFLNYFKPYAPLPVDLSVRSRAALERNPVFPSYFACFLIAAGRMRGALPSGPSRENRLLSYPFHRVSAFVTIL